MENIQNSSNNDDFIPPNLKFIIGNEIKYIQSYNTSSRSSYRKTAFLFVDPTRCFLNHFQSDLRLIDDLAKNV